MKTTVSNSLLQQSLKPPTVPSNNTGVTHQIFNMKHISNNNITLGIGTPGIKTPTLLKPLSHIHLSDALKQPTSIRDMNYISNALRADLDTKRAFKQKLLDELELIKKIARQDQAFETVYKAIDEEYALHEAKQQAALLLLEIGGTENSSPQKQKQAQDKKENRPQQQQYVSTKKASFLNDSESRSSSVPAGGSTQSTPPRVKFQYNPHQQHSVSTMSQQLNDRSLSDASHNQSKSLSLNGPAHDTSQLLAATIEQNMRTLHSNDLLLTKKRRLLDAIKKANDKANNESELYQLQIHYMRDRMMQQKVCDETLMNKELLPQVEFQERAHLQLISRIADTNQKRGQLQQEYLFRYRQIIKSKKTMMVKSLKDRFGKLIKEENETLSLKLKNMHIPEGAALYAKKQQLKSEHRVYPEENSLDEEMDPQIEVNKDSYYMCKRIAESVDVLQRLHLWVKDRGEEEGSEEVLRERRGVLLVMCEELQQTREKEVQMKDYVNLMRIRQQYHAHQLTHHHSVANSPTKLKRRQTVAPGSFLGGGGTSPDHHNHKPIPPAAAAKQTPASNKHHLMLPIHQYHGGISQPLSIEDINHRPGAGGDDTPRRPSSCQVEDQDIYTLTEKIHALLKNEKVTQMDEMEIVREYQIVLAFQQSQLQMYADLNRVKLEREAELKVLQNVYWELWLGKAPQNYQSNSPKRELEDRHMASAIKQVHSQGVVVQTTFYTEQMRSHVLAQLHNFLFKVYIISEVVGPELFPASDRVEKLIRQYKKRWPYTFPEVFREDFCEKVQQAFKKKFVGDDTSNNKASKQLMLDFNFHIGQGQLEKMQQFMGDGPGINISTLKNVVKKDDQGSGKKTSLMNHLDQASSLQKISPMKQLLSLANKDRRMTVRKNFSTANNLSFKRGDMSTFSGQSKKSGKLNSSSPRESEQQNSTNIVVIWELFKQVRELSRYLKLSISHMDDSGGHQMTPPAASKSLMRVFTSKFKNILKTANKSGGDDSSLGIINIQEGGKSLLGDTFSKLQKKSNPLMRDLDEPPHIHKEDPIKELRMKEDLAELNQKRFKERYMKFLEYNEQNMTPLLNRDIDPQLMKPKVSILSNQVQSDIPQRLQQTLQDQFLEDKYQLEAYIQVKATKHQQMLDKVKQLEQARKDAQIALAQKQVRKVYYQKDTVTRLSLVEQTSQVAADSKSQANMKQDRYNFSKLGNYERQESQFRDKFKNKFNDVLGMLSRNDYQSLRHTVDEASKAWTKGSFTSQTDAQIVVQEKKAAEERLQEKLKKLDLPKVKTKQINESTESSESEDDTAKKGLKRKKTTTLTKVGKRRTQQLQAKLPPARPKQNPQMQTFDQQREKDNYLARRCPFNLSMPIPPQSALQQTRSEKYLSNTPQSQQQRDGATFSILKKERLSSVPKLEPVYSQKQVFLAIQENNEVKEDTIKETSPQTRCQTSLHKRNASTTASGTQTQLNNFVVAPQIILIPKQKSQLELLASQSNSPRGKNNNSDIGFGAFLKHTLLQSLTELEQNHHKNLKTLKIEEQQPMQQIQFRSSSSQNHQPVKSGEFTSQTIDKQESGGFRSSSGDGLTSYTMSIQGPDGLRLNTGGPSTSQNRPKNTMITPNLQYNVVNSRLTPKVPNIPAFPR